MNKLGHTGLTLGLYAPIAFILIALDHPILALFGLLGMLAATNVPDVDTLLPFLTHRHQTHTFAFAAFVPVLVAILLVLFHLALPILPAVVPTFWLLVSFFSLMTGFGILSHLLGDAFTPHGVRPYRPISETKISFDLFRSNSPHANGLAFVFGLAAVMAGFLAGISI